MKKKRINKHLHLCSFFWRTKNFHSVRKAKTNKKQTKTNQLIAHHNPKVPKKQQKLHSKENGGRWSTVSLQKHQIEIIHGYPKRMSLQRRLYGIYIVCFRIFMIPCTYKFLSFVAKSFYKPVKDHIYGRRLNLNLEFSYFKSAKSSLQSFVGNPELNLILEFYD